MRLYLAGPMTGKTAYGHAEFTAAADAWRALGHDVETPFDANRRVWRRVYGRDFDPFNDTCEWGDPLLRTMFMEDIDTLMRADAIVMLEGWENSRGATLEQHLAERFGIPAVLAAHPARSLDGCVRAEAAGVRTP